ncbi:hypothetical protein ISN45_Aa02g023560 [Arabidopsis thaliana x Arabidopsis arenosa]|uniref:Uncharacterized protein n=1 Tax=Arabidopsis thaliana x Arabidopsis arenosa TaxID=1240361 RepID=A0A8T2BMA3_9BRAS|nr:hypothetical protein ISN45_Aa02g023560 [Arabidopsis thaliana x Arabidopsis arenosa]
MKTVTGRVNSVKPVSLSKAATLLSGFVSSENGASQDVSAYLRRASGAFTELKSIHRETKLSSKKKRKSDGEMGSEKRKKSKKKRKSNEI